ncbi:phage major capsid protein, P2 family [Aeromonas dhakensis]|uniref:phage major capsid protein, P2 family n=1 Tax=Aeromonas TaxID=642 RepID=UPI001F39AD6E|nr:MULTISPECIES: phage major capsid protein, P2 family [Aeromonas]MCF5767950.1 phage major capsid protein, P2 family [Aeromonas veronii]MCV3284557.1 phage major capsid protein, P2 family [Aeromonas veronii]WPS57061.1 phage major capsid protein, P2 family [Aeromonas dhakensis]HDZ9210392.1 phage major capsid protein, P2 family [Aeromonas dhakensis]
MSQTLTVQAEQRLNKYCDALAKAYGIDITKLGKQFSVTGPVETTLRSALLASVEFLGMITCLDVDQITGQVVQVGVGQLYTGRKKGGRFKGEVGVDGNKYELKETDSCASLSWATLCTWANAGSEGEFIKLVGEFVNTAFALDMLRVGWNGVSAADTTDPESHPLGEDVNKGWHQIAREWNGGSQIIKAEEGKKIYFDPDGKGDYKTLDEMASDLISTTIDPLFQQDPRLVVLVGTDLVAAAQAKIYSEATKPSEQIAAQQLAKSIAGRKAMIPPFFPGKRMVVTTLDNLHCYTQRGTRKRKADDNQDTKSFDNQYWRMEGYALGEHKAYGGFEEADIVIGADPAAPAEAGA